MLSFPAFVFGTALWVAIVVSSLSDGNAQLVGQNAGVLVIYAMRTATIWRALDT